MSTGGLDTGFPMEPERTSLACAIRERRKALRVTMVAAAEAAGISRVTWHRIERGEPTVAMGSWLRAAIVLGVEIRIVDPAEPDKI